MTDLAIADQVSKTHCLVTYDKLEIWITKDQAKKIALSMEDCKMIEVGDDFINVSNISGIYSSDVKMKKYTCSDGKQVDSHEMFEKREKYLLRLKEEDENNNN